MWAKSLLCVFVIFLTSSQACEVNQLCDIVMDDNDIRSMKESMETFTINLMSKMYGDTNFEGNVTFSSTNVFVALYAIMVGTGGTAKDELIAALGLVDKDLTAMTKALTTIVTGLELLNTAKIRSQEITIENLSLGEVLFVQSGLNVVDTFMELLHSLDADSYSKDFSKKADWATRRINQWINNQTGKRNPLTFTSLIDPTTKLLMATAPFFCAKWPDNFFDPAHNGLGTFTSAAGQTNVVMMSTFQTLWFYDDGQSYAAVQLPFANPNFMLVIILPYGQNMDPAAFVQGFTLEMWQTILGQSTQQDITVKIPKLAIAWTNEINEQIQALNVKQIFQGADFPDMIDYSEAQLHISSFTQSAGLTINEIGVSMGDITPPSTNPTLLTNMNNPPAFIMDRPCLVLVQHIQSSLIVFSSFIRQL